MKKLLAAAVAAAGLAAFAPAAPAGAAPAAGDVVVCTMEYHAISAANWSGSSWRGPETSFRGTCVDLQQATTYEITNGTANLDLFRGDCLGPSLLDPRIGGQRMGIVEWTPIGVPDLHLGLGPVPQVATGPVTFDGALRGLATYVGTQDCGATRRTQDGTMVLTLTL